MCKMCVYETENEGVRGVKIEEEGDPKRVCTKSGQSELCELG